MIRLVEAKPEDLDAFYKVHHETTILHGTNLPHIFKKLAEEDEKKYLKCVLEDKNQKVYLTRYGSETVGYAIFAKKEQPPTVFQQSTIGSIDSIGVLQGYRKRGIGQKLLTAGIDWFRGQGIEQIELNVYTFNNDAISFYTKNGFEVLSETMVLSLLK